MRFGRGSVRRRKTSEGGLRAFAGVLLCCVVVLGAACATTPPAEPSSEEALEVIRSQAQLDAYLKANETTPLDALSSRAKARFLKGLRFGTGGLAAMRTPELSRELNIEQGLAILRLFGSESSARTIFPKDHTPLTQEERDSEFERRYSEMLDVQSAWDSETSSEERGRQLAEAYHRLFLNPEEPSTTSPTERDLRTQLEAASMVRGAERRRDHVEEVLRVFRELERHHTPAEEDAKLAHRALIASRRFSEAGPLAERFSGLEKVPDFKALEGHNGQTVWAVEEGPRLVQRPARGLSGTQLIVIASPICAPTKRLVEMAAEDDALRRILEEATWLVPAFGDLLLEPIVDWNQRHGWAPLALVHDEAEWPILQDWATPVFYFVKDGQVQERFVGWFPERRAELMDAATRLGLEKGAFR